jgi:hypothetical protein
LVGNPGDVAHVDGPFPFRGEVIWLTPEQGGRRTGVPPVIPDVSYAQVAHVPPHTANSGSASFVLRGWDPDPWRSPAEGRWLLVENKGDQLVVPGAVLVGAEGAKPVALFRVQELDLAEEAPASRAKHVVETDSVQMAFAPVLGRPCWLARRGHGHFVTFEFGDPRVEVHEPRTRRYANRSVRTRLSTIHGEWHLWIYGGRWAIAVDGYEVAHSGSEGTEVDRSLGLLDGQALTRLDVDPTTGASTFHFDLGGSLRVEPSKLDREEPDDLWLLYEPSGYVARRCDRMVPGAGL